MSDWDFYEGRAGDDRAFIAIDLGLIGQIPMESHPIRLQVRFAMRKPRADGLRSQEEAEAVFAVEDRVEANLKDHASAVFVARIVAQGYTELVYYVPELRGADADDPIAVVGDVSPYELEWLVEEDREWTRYLELFPNRYAMQTIQNRRLVAKMQEVGDVIDVPRVVDHVASFPTEQQARAASDDLVTHGFQVEAATLADERWTLEFHRVDACAGERPDEFVFEVLDLLGPHEGEYDGWGSTIVRG